MNLELGVIQSHLHEGWSRPGPDPVAREQRQWLGWGQGQRASERGCWQREETSYPEKGKEKEGQLPGDSPVPTVP